jgi:hypothetical protein
VPRRAGFLVVVLDALAAAAPAAARPHVRPRAFRSCAQLVRYARAHFSVTHGVPETAIGVASPAAPPNAKVAPPTGLVVLPVQIGDTFDGALGVAVSPTGLTQAGRITQSQVQRAVVVGDRLFTVSDGGVMASSLATLARQAFVAFPTN